MRERWLRTLLWVREGFLQEAAFESGFKDYSREPPNSASSPISSQLGMLGSQHYPHPFNNNNSSSSSSSSNHFYYDRHCINSLI